MSDDKTAVNVPDTGRKNKDFGFFRSVGSCLYYVFVKNWRKKVLAVFSAIVVLFYAYGVILANDDEHKRAVTIYNVRVEIVLDNSEKYILTDETLKVNVIGLVPRQTQEGNINLNAEKYLIRVNANDDDVKRGFVYISARNVVGPMDCKDLDFFFEPRVFLDKDDSKHLTLKVPIEKYEEIKSKHFDVMVEVNNEGFSDDFSVNERKASEQIFVRAPENILKRLRIATEKVSLKNRVRSFHDNVKFKVFDGNDSCDRNFVYDPDTKTLVWKKDEVRQEDLDKRTVEVSVKIDRNKQLTEQVSIGGVLFVPTTGQDQSDLLKQLQTIDFDKMRENQLSVTVRVARKDLKQWNLEKDKLIQAWFDLSDMDRDNQCKVSCILLDSNLAVTILDYSPKKVNIIRKQNP